MAIQTALDFQALDTTYNMIANVRHPFNKGIIENPDNTKKGLLSQDPADYALSNGVITIDPYQLISNQGVVIWDDNPTKHTIGNVSGTFYIVMYAHRTISSSIIITLDHPAVLPSPLDDYIVFGQVTLIAGQIDSYATDYASRMSVEKIGHGKVKGIVSSLPDLTDPVGSSDIKTGDMFITVDSDKVYIHVANMTIKEYRTLTAGSAIGDVIILGSGAHRIILDGTTGEIVAGEGANAAGINGSAGAFIGKTIVLSVNAVAPNVITSILSPFGFSNPRALIFGGGTYTPQFLPNTDGVGDLGIAGRAFGSVTTRLLRPGNVTSAIGSLPSPFQNIYGNNAYITTLQPKENGEMFVNGHVFPTAHETHLLGCSHKRWLSVHSYHIFGQHYVWGPNRVTFGEFLSLSATVTKGSNPLNTAGAFTPTIMLDWKVYKAGNLAIFRGVFSVIYSSGNLYDIDITVPDSITFDDGMNAPAVKICGYKPGAGGATPSFVLAPSAAHVMTIRSEQSSTGGSHGQLTIDSGMAFEILAGFKCTITS